jgi:hypothetical protein
MPPENVNVKGTIMNSNQRSQDNNQTDNGANVKSRDTTADKGNLNTQQDQAQQSTTMNQSRQGQQQAGSEQKDVPGRQSNDAAGGYPRSPKGKSLSADEDMDDDTGLSNRVNRQSAEPDQGSRQMDQSNVGRRDDGTPD